MNRRPAPDEIIRGTRAPLLKLSLRCNQCQKISQEEFEWACLHPDLDACSAQGWDGVSLSRMFRCSQCGAVDEYTLAGDSKLELTGRMLKLLADGEPERIILAESRLWDGTIVRRPSQALARLRELAAQHPTSAEAQRRLGNGCERFGELDEAMAAWRRALELDPYEIEAAYSLIHYLLCSKETIEEAVGLLKRALAAFPRCKYEGEERRNLAAALLGFVREFVQGGDSLALMAGWRGGKVGKNAIVCASSVRLEKVLDVWDRLETFVASRDVLGLEVRPAEPDDDGTQLERLLLAPSNQDRPAQQGARVARNALCPCGSGKKAKRCCGGRDAPSMSDQ